MSSENRGGYLFKLCGLLLVMAALMLWAIPAAAAAENAMAEPSNAADVPCKDLKPFNNLDELLYQFYINLDSDCLFEMPVAELEKIWDIKILSEERAPQPGDFATLRKNSDFRNKPYKSERDAFYIEIPGSIYTQSRVFYIAITQEYYEKHVTLFPDGLFPKLLPEPLTRNSIIMISPDYSQPEPRRPANTGQFNLAGTTYYWVSSDMTGTMTITGFSGVTGITIARGKR